MYSVAISIVGIAWSLTSYHRTVRAAHEDKEKLSVPSAFMLYFWYLFYTRKYKIKFLLTKILF